MTEYINCNKPNSISDNIKCNVCNAEYRIEFDKIKAPFKFLTILNCSCGAELIKCNNTNEPKLIRVNND